MTTANIAALNDAFRSSPAGGHVTAGVHAKGPAFLLRVLIEVARYSAFTPDNDPYGEHDFGSFDALGEKVFWKIDYYARDDFSRGSEDPADPAQTSRVLTIMLASEY